MVKPQVVRLRSLSSGQMQRIQALRELARLLDSAFVIPGTSYRIGLDPIAGLFPVVGDLVSPLFTIGILWQARDFGVPRVVQLRMIFNVAIDTLLGVVPIAGDLFDAAWKANERNMALLERHAFEEQPATRGDWAFVALMIAILIGIAIVPILILGWLVAAVAGLLT
jgi:hypothetical protein